MKKSVVLLFFSFVFVFFCLTLNVYANSDFVIFMDSNFIRKGPSTNYDKLGLENVGSVYNLLDSNVIADEQQNGSCDAGWYKIDYDGTTGYVCSEYVTPVIAPEEEKTEPTTACEAEMKEAGFPSSYWSGLCSLKQAHPNWEFKAVITGLDWTSAVNSFTSCGDSLLQTSNSEWIDTSCSYKEGGFVSVNQEAVAYYLDPRNFFSERYIFQFEDNRYNSALEAHYADIARVIVDGADFYKYHYNLGYDISKDIVEGGKTYNVSPTHLASRMYQELGTGTRLQNLYKGIFNGLIPYYNAIYDFRGYYNFYNIGVSGTCVTSGPGATFCGLTTAKNYSWNSVNKAIVGGSQFVYSKFIAVGQYTSYLERFNVVPTNSSSLYMHYYMANMQAPSSEASTAYNAYKELGLLDSAFVFYIPVYNNMNASIDNSPSGPVDDGGSSSSPSSSAIGAIVTSAGYKISGDIIKGISPKTSVATIKGNLEAIAGTGNVKVQASETYIGTGSKITITNSSETKTLTVLVYGDTSGDGEIGALDLLQVQKNILGASSLTGVYKEAADTSRDGVIGALDLLQMQKEILGAGKVNQS